MTHVDVCTDTACRGECLTRWMLAVRARLRDEMGYTATPHIDAWLRVRRNDAMRAALCADPDVVRARAAYLADAARRRGAN